MDAVDNLLRGSAALNPISDPKWSFSISFFRHPPLPTRQKKSVPVCDFTFLLPEIHVLVITAIQKVGSLKGTQTNFWRYVFGLANA